MNLVRYAVAVLLASLLAAPAYAQQAGSAESRPAEAPATLASAALRPLPPALTPAPVYAHSTALTARPPSTAAHGVIGVGVGALAGLALIALSPNCWEADSMCGIAILPMAGVGAVVGGVVGLGVGAIRNR
ncbi:hypothetical protein [Longimicrobium sp.]|jgi:hypothetical protein|uniref:hypothetical protein n=1 Tax=Longimicrobium sp. TaxID=2029185 RepID=UPI002ED9369C